MGRGQLTLFAILGLIVFVLVAILIFVSQETVIQEVPEEESREDYDARIFPMIRDVEFCLESLSREAFVELGARGGFLNINTELYLFNSFPEHIDNALQVFPGSDLILPYWYYIEGGPDCINCRPRFNIPPLTGVGNSIQAQVERHVESNLLECVNYFEDYAFDFNVVYGAPDTLVEFFDESIAVSLNWPLNITFPDGTASFKYRFEQPLDLRFRKIYELALSTLFQMQLLEDSYAFEDFTIDVVSYLSLGGVDVDVPPISGPVVSGYEAPRMWVIRDVKDILKDRISQEISYVQVPGSRDSYVLFSDDVFRQNIYNRFQHPVAVSDPSFLADTKIRFNYYPFWPMYLNIRPGFGGEVAMPEVVEISLFFLRFSDISYSFDYDVSYPVLVSFEDAGSFGGEGYFFQFPFQVNVRDNNPYFNETVFIDEHTTLIASEGLTSAFGDPAMGNVPVRIKVVSGYDSLPIPNVSVVYHCVEDSVFVGTSELIDGEAIIEAMLPTCLGGYFSAVGPSYSSEDLFVDLILDEEASDLELTVYLKKDVEIRLNKRNFAPAMSYVVGEMQDEPDFDRDWQVNPSFEALSSIIEDEEILVLFTEVLETGEAGMIEFASFDYENLDGSVSLSPGEYSVRVISFLNMGDGYSRQNLTIPERRYEFKERFLGVWTIVDEEVVLPEVVFNDSLFLGYALFDESTVGFVNITSEDLIGSDIIDVYYAAYDPDNLRFIQDLDVFNLLMNATVAHPDLFMPRFR